jgi:hypothetical protein
MKNELRTKKSILKLKQDYLNSGLDKILSDKNITLDDIRGVSVFEKRITVGLFQNKRLSLKTFSSSNEALINAKRLRILKKINDILAIMDSFKK